MTDLGAAVEARLEAFTADRVAERLWARDGSLWAASGKAGPEVAGWLGWLGWDLIFCALHVPYLYIVWLHVPDTNDYYDILRL